MLSLTSVPSKRRSLVGAGVLTAIIALAGIAWFTARTIPAPGHEQTARGAALYSAIRQT